MSITVPPDVAERDIFPPVEVLIKYWVPLTKPPIAVPPPELYVTLEPIDNVACWSVVNLMVLSVILTIPVPNTSSSLPSKVIGAIV